MGMCTTPVLQHRPPERSQLNLPWRSTGAYLLQGMLTTLGLGRCGIFLGHGRMGARACKAEKLHWHSLASPSRLLGRALLFYQLRNREGRRLSPWSLSHAPSVSSASLKALDSTHLPPTHDLGPDLSPELQSRVSATTPLSPLGGLVGVSHSACPDLSP